MKYVDSIAWTFVHPSIAFVIMVAVVCVCAVGAIAAWRDL